MLKSYEVIIENDRIKWLKEEPKIFKARAIVTILSDTVPQTPRRQPAAAIAGKGKTLGDLVSSIVNEQDWECLK